VTCLDSSDGDYAGSTRRPIAEFVELDDDLVKLFLANAPATLDGLEDASHWNAVLDAEPQLEAATLRRR
jgi:hypothetical protein